MRAKSTLATLLIAALTALAPGCGSDTVELSNPGDGDNEPCSPDSTQCNNCIDDDGDGLTDGFDPECISAGDDREDSFATGIPGDNIDAIQQDCFFDGDSGQGNDGCNIHVCCLLDVNGTGECPDNLQPNRYDPDECTPTQRCIDNCAPITPPGCDCFGCCTVCADGQCQDILLNTNDDIAPDCDQDSLDDPALCPRCTKVGSCDVDCDPASCILCPGQSQDDLPPECNNQNECPENRIACETSQDCPDTQFCATGCCIDQIL